MSTRKAIDRGEWVARLEAFNSTNRGRKAAIATLGTTIAEELPLVGIYYDPMDKGNDIVFQLESFSHTISAPVELYLTVDEDGVVYTVEVKDENRASSYLRLLK